MQHISKVKQTIEQHALLAPGDTVIVAVSGGADSTALLHLLAALRQEWNLTLVSAHLNHRLRPDSEDDARFVSRMAAQLDIAAVTESADVRAIARRYKISLEEAGRQARYEFLERLAGRRRAHRIATGHTRDDVVETVLMRLVRGDPWDALLGIPIVRTLGTAQVIRPLLGVTREQVRSHLAERSIPWREDPTNRDLRFVRNWIRLRLLPELQRHVPGVQDLLLALSRTIRSANGLLDNLVRSHAAAGADVGTNFVRIPLEEFRRHPRGVQRRMLRWAASQVLGTPTRMPIVAEEKGLRVAAQGRAGDIADFGGVAVRIHYDALEVTPPQPPVAHGEYRLTIPGTVTAEAFGVTLTADIAERSTSFRPSSAPSNEVYLDAASLGGELRVRSWRPGDRMIPLGMRGKKKVHDVFVDDKVPRWERHRTPIVTDAQGGIVWIVGRRIAETVRITDRTQRVVRLTVHRAGAGPARFGSDQPSNPGLSADAESYGAGLPLPVRNTTDDVFVR